MSDLTTLASGSSIVLTVTEQQCIVLNNGRTDTARLAITTGPNAGSVVTANHNGRRTYGPFGAGTITLSAISGDVRYELSGDASSPLADDSGFTATQESSLRSLVSGGWIPSSLYWTHCFAPFQGNADAALYDQSGMGNDGALGTTLSKAEAWANLGGGFVTTVDPAAGEDASVLRFPALQWDYAAGESLCFFWKGQIVPEGSSMVFFGTSAFSSTQGFGFRCTATGKLDFFLSPGASGAVFGNSTTAAPFVSGETHSVCVFVDGVSRQYAVFVDGAADLALQSLGSGVSIDTKTAGAVSLGTGNPSAGTTGIATKTQALAVLRRGAGVGLPADLSSIARALHRNPARLVSSLAW